MIYGDKYLIKVEEPMMVLTEDKICGVNFNMCYLHGKSNPCIIKVKYEAGEIPHFHIYYNDKEGAIEIVRPNYYNHNPGLTLTLKTPEAKALNEWMYKPYYQNPKINNWQAIAYYWNKSDKDDVSGYVPNRTTQPNYSLLNK